jgi:hypothetical protein
MSSLPCYCQQSADLKQQETTDKEIVINFLQTSYVPPTNLVQLLQFLLTSSQTIGASYKPLMNFLKRLAHFF